MTYAPGFTPKPSQAHDLEQLRKHDYRGLLNIETGYGKTVVSCMAAVDSGSQVVLIIAPQSTHRTAWQKDAKLVAGVEVRIIGNKNKAQKSALSDLEFGIPGWYITTPQFFTRQDSTTWHVDMLIADEVHQLGAPGKTGQRKLSGYDLQEDYPIAQRARYALALSATPARNSFERMWSVMRMLWYWLNQRHEVAYDNHWLWMRDRMTSETIYTGQTDDWGNKKTATKWLNEAEPGKLLSEAPCVIQHFKRERCCDFHPEGFLDLVEPQVIERDIFLNADQKRILKELEEQSLAWLEENPLIVELPIVMHQRIRQVALGVPKIEYAENPDPEKGPIAMVTYDLDCKSPVVDEVLVEAEKLGDAPFLVYLESQKFAEVLVHRLNKAGISAAEYSGRRKCDLSQFGKEFRAVVGVLSAIGTGTDGLQHVTNEEVWVQRSLDETINEQAAGRTDRTGQVKQVQRKYLIDDLGMFSGQLSQAMQRRLDLNRSLRKRAA